MLVECHIIAWNEADTIALTINHYKTFCDRIILHDNLSDDGTDTIAIELGAEVRKFGRHGELSDKEYLKIKNQVWKKSDADWVILVDCDEILQIDRQTLQSEKDKSKTIFNTYGWQVFSKELPLKSFSEITNGFHDRNYSKLAVFNPKALLDINYSYGCHTAFPKGRVEYSDVVIPLFHYRNIGGPERLIARHRLYRKRLSPLNKELGLGCHYSYPDERRVKEWNEQYEKSAKFSPGGF